MAVALRLKRLGNTHRPFYRIVSIDKSDKRDGAVIEELGTYDPLGRHQDKQIRMNKPRVAYWISVGAQPSETVAGLCRRVGLEPKPGTDIDAQGPLDEPAKADIDAERSGAAAASASGGGTATATATPSTESASEPTSE